MDPVPDFCAVTNITYRFVCIAGPHLLARAEPALPTIHPALGLLARGLGQRRSAKRRYGSVAGFYFDPRNAKKPQALVVLFLARGTPNFAVLLFHQSLVHRSTV